MARRVDIVLADDIDGSDADQTVRFALDGASYEIDLNERNAGALRVALDQYVASARKVSGRNASRGRRKPAAPPVSESG